MKKTSRMLMGLALTWAAVGAGHGADGLPPRVVAVEPEPGTVTNLSQITVTFSEPVTNVVVTDLLLNGQSLVLEVAGSGALYTFSLSQQPPYGPVQVSWDPGHDIRDLDDAPGHRMDESDPVNLWQYTLADATPPAVAQLTPAPGTTVRQLSQIEVVFSEAVVGVEAGDLQINGLGATNVSVRGVGRYLFQFPAPAVGTVAVAWAGGHGIQDFAVPPNAFAGGAWTYTLDPGAGLPALRINEFLAANVTGLKDEDGDASDWIELWNYGASDVHLGGYALTDDPQDPGKWIFPSTNLAPGRFLVVFASGKDRRTVTSSTNRWHTNFRLNRFGNYLALFNPESPRVALSEFAPEYPEQRNDYAYGYDANHALKYLSPPTPGAANGASSLSGVVPQPHVNVDRGFFGQPFTLIASVALPEAILRYTLDGSEPTATNARYTGPLVISNTTVFRLAAFATNRLPSRTETHTYVFLDQVLRQPNNPPGFPVGPTVFAGYPSDYEMDPEIVTNTPAFVTSSLRSLPVLSLAIKNDDMFGPVNGIYTHPEPPAAQRYLWERACSAELILTNGDTGFHVDCGIRIQGNASRTPIKTPKHPFRLFFRGDYGPGRLEYRLFPDAPLASFESLVLRADFNNSWVHWDPNQRLRGNKVRDAWTKESFRDMNGLSGHTRHCHLYVNGLYWGVYDFGERIDADFAAAYLGGTADQYDAIVSKPTEAIDGTLDAYRAMTNLGRSLDMRQFTNYDRIQQHLDLPVFVDYMLLNFYGANQDWGFDGNWNAVRRRDPAGTFKYVPWDGEQLVVDVNNNRVTSADLPSGLHTNLVNSPEYRLAFADRAHKHLFNGGALAPQVAGARWLKWAYAVEPGMLAESARWGDYRRDVHPYQDPPYYLYTTNGHWWPEILRMRDTYFPARGGILLQQLRSAGLYPAVAAPSFSQHGGRVARGFALTITATNPVYYTTDGSDPRVAGTGAVSPTARLYSSSVPVALPTSTVIKARALSSSTWSALNEAAFTVEMLTPPLRITEIMYNPVGGDAYEFIELQNAGPDALDVSGFSLVGVTYIFPVGTVLAPGQTLVLGSSAAPGNWTNRYPGVTAWGRFDGSLSNGGEKLGIKDRNGNVIWSVDYDDENGWPTAADGLGYSLEISDPFGDPDAPANWHASAAGNGTPGTVTAPLPLAPVQINEVMADNLTAVNHGGTFPDWIELYNAGLQPVNLEGWSLTDGGDPRRFVFPAGTMMDAGGYLVVWCDDTTNTTPGLHAGFALNRQGESVLLYDASTSRVDAVTFGLQLPDFTVGRIGDDWQLTVPTTNAPNQAVMSLASATNLVLNEWLANAPPGADDWLELYNRSGDGPVALQGVSLNISNTFFQITSLSFVPAGGFVQLFADEEPGPDHLDFRLPAAGGTLVLYDETATERDRVTYGPQAEDVTQGRLPDGSGSVVSFPGTPSPGAPNFVRLYTGPVLNEILAVNRSAVTNAWGETADWIELVNSNDFDFDVTGYRLSDDATRSDKWFFPPGVAVPAHGYLVVCCDGGRPASLAPDPVLNTGFALDGDSGGVYLLDPAGRAVDAVVYGFQVADRSIGRWDGAWGLLAEVSPGGANAAPASLAAPAGLRLNEWMANPLSGDDWFEIYNPASDPVELSRLFLADEPTSTGLTEFQVAPLSFIGPGGYVRWIADGEPGKGLHHVNFNLDADGESLRLSSATGEVIDTVYFGPQAPDMSQGRLPDGAPHVVSFSETPTPAASNYLPLPNAVINEVLARPTDPLEDAIEIYNPTDTGVDLSGWFLSNREQDFTRVRIPDGTFLPGGGYAVFYQAQFNPAGTTGFALDGARGDTVYLSEADAAGNLSGYRAQVAFGAAANGLSLGRFDTCAGPEFAALDARTFGADAAASVEAFRLGTGLPNAGPRVGPVVIHEIMYHPPDLAGTDNSRDEYLELANASPQAVELFDPARPTNTWRLRGGVEFTFPPGVVLPAHGCLLVVNFNPLTEPAQLAAFRALYQVAPEIAIFGPYGGKLDNGGERLELAMPDTPRPAPDPEAARVPYLLVDAVAYSDAAPWPVGGDGDGASLQRRDPNDYGNDPSAWVAGAPTAGRTNVAWPPVAPTIVVQPLSRAVPANAPTLFHVSACGARPLIYQWLFEGNPLDGETNASLRLADLQPAQAGPYAVVVANLGGSVTSAPARLTLMVPPTITGQPQGQTAYAGTNVSLSVAAEGAPPLNYQWRWNGIPIAGADQAVLLLTNVQPEQSGDYSVLVGNPAGSVASAVASLDVPVPPRILLQPQGTNVSTNVTVTLSVAAAGTGVLRYQWLFHGLPLDGATNASLVLSNVQLPQSGPYAVLVRDDLSGVVSQTAWVTVLVRPAIVVQPTNTVTVAGGSASFFVQAYGTTPMSFRWRRGGATFTNGLVFNTPSTSTLVLTNVPAGWDGTNFNVVITNLAPGSTTSTNAYLTVLRPPLLSEPRMLAEDTFQFLLEGNRNRSYVVEISTDLREWVPLRTLQYTNGRMPVIDATATNGPPRFYRAWLAP